MMLSVGDKVVCTTQPHPKKVAEIPDVKWPAKDGVYTIRAIDVWPAFPDDEVLLRFEELDNRHLEGVLSKIEPGFPAKYFVPEKASRKDRVRA